MPYKSLTDRTQGKHLKDTEPQLHNSTLKPKLKQRCGAKTRAGSKPDAKHPGRPCQRPAGFGTDHPGFGRCKYHGGNTWSGERAAAEEEMIFRRTKFGELVPIDPITALVNELARSNGIVEFLARELIPMSIDELIDNRGRVIRQLYEQERGALTRVAKACVDIGLQERQIALAERMGALVNQVFTQVLAELPISQAVREAAIPLLANKLREVAGGSATLPASATQQSADARLRAIETTATETPPTAHATEHTEPHATEPDTE